MLQFNSFLSGGGGGGNISGNGTPPYLPIWLTPTTLGDSTLYQGGGGNPQYLYSDYINEFYINVDDTTGAGKNGTYGFMEQDLFSGANNSFAYYGSNANNNGGNGSDASWYCGFTNNNVGISDQFSMQYTFYQGGNPQRYFQMIHNGYIFLQHNYYNNQTRLFNQNDGQLVPLGEDSYNLYQGGGKSFGFGAGGSTGAGLFFGNTWHDYYPNLAVTYSFTNSNVVSGCFSETRFQLNTGSWLFFATAGGNRRMYASFTSLIGFDFQVNSNATNITALAGMQIHGLYVFNNPNNNQVNVTNYYGIYINDSNEYGNAANVIVSGRYALYQEGGTDMVQFNGKMGFYGAPPVFQQQNTIASAARAAVGGANVQANDTFGGYTIGQIVTALKAYGLLN